MKAWSHQPIARGSARAVPRSFCAPSLLAAYALGATLWAPAIVLIAGQFEGAFVRLIPGFPFAGAARMLVPRMTQCASTTPRDVTAVTPCSYLVGGAQRPVRCQRSAA